MREVVITCNPDGTIKIDAIGFKGQACEKATAEVEKALGGKVKSKSKKPEYYQDNQATH